MSWRALQWALVDAPTTSAQELVVLIALADRADDRGRGAWPSLKSLARAGRCSERTVQRHLAALKRRGVIVEGDWRRTAHLPIGRRPNVWDLNLTARKEDSPKSPERISSSGVSTRAGSSGADIPVTPVTADVLGRRAHRPPAAGRSESTPEQAQPAGMAGGAPVDDRTMCPPEMRGPGEDFSAAADAAAVADPPESDADTEPPRSCGEHPIGVYELCRPCLEARHRHSVWVAEHAGDIARARYEATRVAAHAHAVAEWEALRMSDA